jgi:hypothetical protein
MWMAGLLQIQSGDGLTAVPHLYIRVLQEELGRQFHGYLRYIYLLELGVEKTSSGHSSVLNSGAT